MLVYRGALDDAHLRACIRLALRAHGFSLSGEQYKVVADQQWQHGCWLRDEVFPKRMSAFLLAQYEAIREQDPLLWDRLPLMAGLGFRQAEALHGLASISPEAGRAVAILGAAFNIAISLLDYLVDETKAAKRLFELLHRGVVRAIFNNPDEAQMALAGAQSSVADPRMRLLFAFVTECANCGRNLYRATDNHAAWTGLADLIERLFDAERVISQARFPSLEEAHALLATMETKSSLPSVAILQMSTLASRLKEPPEQSRHAAATLGRVFWRIDDLVDLFADMQCGIPNAIAVRLADRLSKEDRCYAGDTDVYDEVDSTARELVELLQPRGFGLNGTDPPDRALWEVLRFACMTIAGWAGWHEDISEVAMSAPSVGISAPMPACARAATEALLAYQHDGYQEAIHHLRLPRLSPAGVRYETCPALLSHRAVALDALLDAWDAGLPVPHQVLDAEALSILRSKHRDVRGGWSYIQEVTELPPDADDLGQVLQVLCRLGGPALASTCEDGIRLALDAADPNGGSNTWILDHRGYSLADERVREYLGVMGGWGIHPEVVANLLYGLILCNPVRYQGPLIRAVTYLELAQHEHGFWPSKWYTGPYYGTYRVACVLGRVAPNSAALHRSREFLLDAQCCEGGWGDSGAEPLSTALALLALCSIRGPCVETVRGGVEFLVAAQLGDGSWPACPWIAFPTVDGPVAHGSSTITTAFCLKALLAAGLASQRQASSDFVR